MRHQLRTDSSHRVPDCERSALSSWDHAPCVLCPFHESAGPAHCLQEMARSALRQRPKAFPRQLPSYRAAGHAHFLSTRNESSAREFPKHGLEVCSKARHPGASFPVLSRSPTLETVSTKQPRMLLLHIAEARNVDAVGPMSERNL